MHQDSQKQLVEALSIPALLLDSSFHILKSNKAADKMLGNKISGLDFVRVFRQPELLQCLTRALKKNRRTSCDFVLDLQTTRSFQANAAPINCPDTNSSFLLFTMIDVSAIRYAEKARSTFVANVSHELRSPLTALLGAVETLKGPARNDASARMQFLELMQREAERMSRLIEDLLSLSKLEATEHLPPDDRVDLLTIIPAVEQSLAASKNEYKGRVELLAPEEIPMVRGSHDELIEVFQNLIENALKYSRPGTPVTIRISHKTTKANWVNVRIEDIGEGIAPKHIPRLTERFYRVDKGRSRQIGGTGLGLAITKHILNRHRARLLIKSKLSQGTSVTVKLRV